MRRSCFDAASRVATSRPYVSWAKFGRSSTFLCSCAAGFSYLSKIDRFQNVNAEHGSTATQGAWTGTAGAGKIASLTFDLVYPDDPVNNAHPINVMWADLINHSDADSAARLSRDAENEIALVR